MKRYKIEIHSLGFDDITVVVDHAPTKTDILAAKAEWCRHNDIDVDSEFELPFTRITRLAGRETPAE